MQHYSVKDYITGSQLMLQYNEQVILDLRFFVLSLRHIMLH